MSDFAEMWARLEQHQSFADERGYGKKWKRMCEERTPESARAAAWAARAARSAVAADAATAAWTAMVAAKASAEWAADAIKNINKAEEANL